MKCLTPISRNLYVKRSQALLGRGRPRDRNHASAVESRSRCRRSESDPGSFQTQAGIRTNGKIGIREEPFNVIRIAVRQNGQSRGVSTQDGQRCISSEETDESTVGLEKDKSFRGATIGASAPCDRRRWVASDEGLTGIVRRNLNVSRNASAGYNQRGLVPALLA